MLLIATMVGWLSSFAATLRSFTRRGGWAVGALSGLAWAALASLLGAQPRLRLSEALAPLGPVAPCLGAGLKTACRGSLPLQGLSWLARTSRDWPRRSLHDPVGQHGWSACCAHQDRHVNPE